MKVVDNRMWQIYLVGIILRKLKKLTIDFSVKYAIISLSETCVYNVYVSKAKQLKGCDAKL